MAECNDLIPEICGNNATPTMTECVDDEIIPQIDCIKAEIYLGACD